MAMILMPNFMTDPAEYAEVEAIWQNLWSALLREVGQEGLWRTPWLNTRFADGTHFRDGNPIFTAVCPTRRLGVRVVQIEVEQDSDELRTWTDFFAKGEPEEIKELVIHCVLSNETLRQATELIRSWVQNETIER
jgi:hypothetical protein